MNQSLMIHQNLIKNLMMNKYLNNNVMQYLKIEISQMINQYLNNIMMQFLSVEISQINSLKQLYMVMIEMVEMSQILNKIISNNLMMN